MQWPAQPGGGWSPATTGLLLAGTYLLGFGLATGVPIVDWGTPEEEATRDAGMVVLGFGLRGHG